MGNTTFIIAEAGVNHNGSIEKAKELIRLASEAGADAIKFQTFKADKLVSKNAPKADYQKETTGNNENQYEMIKKLELNEEDHFLLKDYCEQNNIIFLSSPFDNESIDFLHHLGLNIFKVPSGEIINYPYLKKMASYNKEIILSTGMSNLSEIESALNLLTNSGTEKEKITVLHCNTEYPSPIEDVNLNAMLTIKNAFKVRIGYSDHTLGIEVPIAAVSLGATVIEKHFTLDKNMDGPDHRASLEPKELEAMIRGIRNIEKAMGDGIKHPSNSELKNKTIVRKSIVAARKIEKNEIFTDDNITTKRPGNGINPMRWTEVTGKKAIKEFDKDELIQL